MYNSPTSFRVSFRDVFLRPIIKTHLLKEEADTSFHPLKFITSQPFLPLDSTHLRRWQLGVFPVGRRAPFSAMHSQPVTHHHGGAVLQSKASRSREVLRGKLLEPLQIPTKIEILLVFSVQFFNENTAKVMDLSASTMGLDDCLLVHSMFAWAWWAHRSSSPNEAKALMLSCHVCSFWTDLQ